MPVRPTAEGRRVLEQYRDLETGPGLEGLNVGDRAGAATAFAGVDALGGLDHAFDAGFADGGGGGGGDGGGGDGGGGD